MKSQTIRSIVIPLATLVGAAGAAGVLIVSCNSDSGPVGGDVEGVMDMHCIAPDGGLITQTTSQNDCQYRPPIDAPLAIDAPPPTADAPPDFGATMYNATGDDDDCKYHVVWTSTPIQENKDVFFTVVATVNGSSPPASVTGANIYAEVYLSSTHEAPPTNQSASEMPPGTYKVGPIRFDAPGNWTVRFHLFENCLDYADDSPHGHAAFYVDVP